jgi:hypothetical protein
MASWTLWGATETKTVMNPYGSILMATHWTRDRSKST